MKFISIYGIEYSHCTIWYPSSTRNLRNCAALRRCAFVLTGRSNITSILISLFISVQLQRNQVRQFQFYIFIHDGVC